MRKTQRFVCRACGRSFLAGQAVPRIRYAKALVIEAVRQAVFEAASCTEVARRFGVHRKTIRRWIRDFAHQLPAHFAFNATTPLQWSGAMVVDGKQISLPGDSECCFVAVDAVSTDLIHWALEPAETKEPFEFFLTVIRDHIKYPLWGLASDLGRSRCFVAPTKSVFPHARHQACIVHYFHHWFPYLGIVHHRNRQQNQILRTILTNMLMADSRLRAQEWRDYLIDQRARFTSSRQRRAIAAVLRNFERFTAHYGEPDLPRHTNLVENVIGRLQSSTAAWRGLRGHLATHDLLKSWFWFYRTAPLDNSRLEERKRRSPLQLNGFRHTTNWTPTGPK